jgi:hypothetical protein
MELDFSGTMQGVGLLKGPRAISTVRKEAEGSTILQLAGQVSIIPGPDSFRFPLHCGFVGPVRRCEIASPRVSRPCEATCYSKPVG